MSETEPVKCRLEYAESANATGAAYPAFFDLQNDQNGTNTLLGSFTGSPSRRTTKLVPKNVGERVGVVIFQHSPVRRCTKNLRKRQPSHLEAGRKSYDQ